jgi:N-acetylmuramoyl-L-alanine amidase
MRGVVFYIAPNGDGRSRAAAKCLEAAMVEAGFPSLGLRERELHVLVGSKGPAVLVELGFLTNKEDAAMLCKKEDRIRYARALAIGVAHAVAR